MQSFSSRVAGWLNGAAVTLGLAIGHQTGLLDGLDALRRAGSTDGSTIAEIAQHTGLQPRYVREWLGLMTCAGVVDLRGGDDDVEAGRYLLPEEHAACLTRSAGSGNMAVYAQEIPMLTQHMSQIVYCFKHGGGVGYDEQPAAFQALMAEMSAAKVQRSLVQSFVPSVPGLEGKLTEGTRVLDIGCGQGVAVLQLADAFPRSVFVGIDLDAQAVAAATAAAAERGLANATFEVMDAAALVARADWAGSFGYIYANDAIHDQAQPARVLEGARAVLSEDGGLMSVVDIDADSTHRGNLKSSYGPFLYCISLMHCMTVSLAQGGMGLGMMWGRQQAQRMLEAAGFSVQLLPIPGDGFNVHYLCRPTPAPR